MAKSNRKLKANWERNKAPKMLLAHFSKTELQGLDILQGGADFDPETGLRQYVILGKKWEDPKFAEEMYASMSPMCHATQAAEEGKEPFPARLKGEYKRNNRLIRELQPWKDAPGDKTNALARGLGEEGTEGDNRMAFIPPIILERALQIGYKPKFNEHTGLLMFGKAIAAIGRAVSAPFRAVASFARGRPREAVHTLIHPIRELAPIGNTILPIGAGIFGTMLGGPAGGMAAAAGTRGLLGYAENENPTDTMRGMAGSGIGALAGGYAPALGVSAPVATGLGHFGGRMLTGDTMQSAAQGGIGHGLGTWGAGQLGFGPAAAAPSASSAMAGGYGQLGPSAVAGKAVADRALGVGAASPGFFSGIGNMFSGSNLLIPAAMAGLSWMGAKQQHKHAMRTYEDQKAAEEKERARQINNLKAAGYDDPWVPVKYRLAKSKRNPEFYNVTGRERELGVYPAPYLYEGDPGYDTADTYATGGHVKHNQAKVQSVVEGVLVKGKGKGQQDLIKTTVPENSYIIDASATSMFGDGSSDAGAKVLKTFEQQVKSRFPKHKTTELSRHLEKTTRQLPVWLSDSEYKFDPVTVTLLGDGSNTKGAKMLKSMVQNIRAEKSKKGGGLPSKAKSPWHYMGKGVV